MNISGIYKITCKPTGKLYIGSTNNFNRRFRRHKSDLKNNTHENRYLQRAWNKYGNNSFEFDILEQIQNDLIKREQYWIEKLNTRTIGFNLQDAGKPPVNSGSKHWLWKKGYLQLGVLNPCWGKKHTEEWKFQKSIARTGQKHSEKTKRKMALNKKNLKLNTEQILQIKLLLKHRDISNNQIAKRFNVSNVTIASIKSGKTHRYIGE